MIPISLANSAQMQVLATTGMHSFSHKMVPSFEAKSGNQLIASDDTSNIVLNRGKSGESSDLIILTRAAMDDLIQQGKVSQIGRTNIAQSGIGVAIKTGSMVPNISQEFLQLMTDDRLKDRYENIGLEMVNK
jgi:molybdate transport system substrate-binding protein